MAADHTRESEQREEQPLDTGPPAMGDPLPNSITFWPGAGETPRENSLPYEMSLIEHGELQRAAGGGVSWNTADLQPPPHWIDANNKQVTSFLTGKYMSWLPDLPMSISRDVPAWQLTHWFRLAASQGYRLTQQDILDRMPDPITYSSLSNRMQNWQREIGILPQQFLVLYNWPSKQSMEVISRLSYLQLKLNTWWDVLSAPDPAGSSKHIYIAIQPRYHEGYRDSWRPLPEGTTYSASYYVIENPEHRQMSEQVKLMDDAMLFLTIKAEECGIDAGFHGIMSWIAKPAGDKWTEDLDVDLVCEFERWREGCPDSPSVEVLRSALEFAGSGAEREAIMNADYRLTPSLQSLVDDLASAREERRLSGAETMTRLNSKIDKRIGTKRKA
jgi:hypothetical protein